MPIKIAIAFAIIALKCAVLVFEIFINHFASFILSTAGVFIGVGYPILSCHLSLFAF